jgi:hypothetical protein
MAESSECNRQWTMATVKRTQSSSVVTIMYVFIITTIVMARARQWLGGRRTGRRTGNTTPQPWAAALLLCYSATRLSSLVSSLVSRLASRLCCAAACVRARVQPSARYRPARLDACARSGGKGAGQAGRGGTEAQRD